MSNNHKSLYFYKIEIGRVVDGDTIVCRFDLGLAIYTTEYVRLHGIDTPEVRGVNYKDKGHWSTLFAERWLRGVEDAFPNHYLDEFTKGRDALTEFYKRYSDQNPYLDDIYLDSTEYNPRDVYGRVLGVIYREGEQESLNEALIRRGLAEEWLG